MHTGIPITVETPATKQEVYRWLNKFNEKTVREEINKTIAEKRDIPIMEARHKKVLKPSEVNAVLQAFA